MKKKDKSALAEVDGVEQPESISGNVREIIGRRKVPSADELLSGIFAGDISSLSRAITLVESSQPKHQEKAVQIISGCLPKAGNSVRIGITGVPGVGKSTFIEALGKHLTSQGKKVAVLAVDPSSSISHGSILGDKTRMEELVKDSNAYIRPSASGETLGGVAAKTRETITLCEAFGFEVIIIETVGVGQSETAVHGMVDFFLLLKIAGAGDELQGIKRGIMEMADAVIINKADGDNLKKAKQAAAEFSRALHLFPPKPSGWTPKVATCSSLTKDGIPEVWNIINEYVEASKTEGYFDQHRTEQNRFWFHDQISSGVMKRFYENPRIQSLIREKQLQIEANAISPFQAAQEVLSAIDYSS